MASPPDAHDNTVHGAVSGQLLQARDIHGGVTINVPPAPPAPLSDVSLDPPRLATAVRGREELLAELGAAMKVGAPAPHVLTGPGGFGKTTVAAALAERARADGWTVFWVRPGSVAASMLEAAVEVGGSRAEADQVRPTRRQAARWVWRHLNQAPRPWLLVIDNADRPEELDPENRPGDQLGWMRASPGGFVLVTSRVDDPAQWAPAQVHRIGQLDDESAIKALTDHAGLADLPGANELAERLGGVPLALFLAGRILATHRVLFPDCNALLVRINKDVAALDDLAAPIATSGEGGRRTLSGVWDLSLRLVAETEPHADPLLRMLSVLGSDGIAVPLRRLPVRELRDGALDGVDDAGLARTINALVVHGLVAVVRDDEIAIRLHPLVSETVRATMSDADLPLLDEIERLLAWQRDRDLMFEVSALSQLFLLRTALHPFRETPPRTTGGMAKAIAHMESIVGSSVSLMRTMLLLGEHDAVGEDERHFLDVSSEILGKDHPLLLSGRHYLAESSLAQGRIEEAEPAFRALYEDRRRVLGPDHADTIDTYYQLGVIALRQGDTDIAETVLDEVRDKRIIALGENHPATLFATVSLAYIAMERGDTESAKTDFQRVLDVRRETLGTEHTLTLDAAYYLALATMRGGDPETAITMFSRTLWTRVALSGEEHPQAVRIRERLDEAGKLLTDRLSEALRNRTRPPAGQD